MPNRPLPKWWIRLTKSWAWLSHLDTAISWTYRLWEPIKWVVRGLIVVGSAISAFINEWRPLVPALVVFVWVMLEIVARLARQTPDPVPAYGGDTIEEYVTVTPPKTEKPDLSERVSTPRTVTDIEQPLRSLLMEQVHRGLALKRGAEEPSSMALASGRMPTTEQQVNEWEDRVCELLYDHPRLLAEFMVEQPLNLHGFLVVNPLSTRLEHRLNTLQGVIWSL